ncbi:MAG: hypothetical protein N3A66_00590, partial [Planctomycetota bacterium]|nr:hypothetical protein [Planctomycetota bacterium]
MKTDLTFAIITPRSLARGLTGGIIARLLSAPLLEFVGVRMYAPSDRFVDEYHRIIAKVKMPRHYHEAYLDFIATQYRRDTCLANGYTNRLMVLFFRGRDALSYLNHEIVGDYQPKPSAKTLRDTFANFSVAPDGSFREFEPAVDTPPTPAANRELLRLLARFAESDGGVIERAVPQPPGVKFETTLVMIKPDYLQRPSALPGNIIGMLSTIGLYIVGARLFHMSVEQGFRFYGFLEDVFVTRLKFLVEKKLRAHLAGAMGYPLSDSDYSRMADVIKRKNAHYELCKIIEYMTGVHPDTVRSKAARMRPGPARCFALLYTGEGAIRKVRDKLGATDPRQAAAGTIR